MIKKIVSAVLLSLLVLPVFAQDKKHNLSVAFETSNYKYNEPNVAVRWDGTMYGVVAQYIGRSILSDSTEVDPGEPSFLNLELRYMQGSVDYDGRLQNGTGMKVNDIDDYFVEGRLTFGAVYEFPKAGAELWPYLGFGYRFLHDGFGDFESQGGYDRDSNYIYIPIGLDAKFKAGKGWSLTLNAEYDFFLYGTQKSKMGTKTYNILPYGPLTFDMNPRNEQTSGYGVRLSVKAAKNFSQKVGFFAEPFFRYWHVSDSDVTLVADRTNSVAFAFMEPENETLEWGLRLGLTF